MKRSPITMFVSSIMFLSIIACGVGSPTATPGLSDADVAATVDAAVAATNTAEAGMAATIEAAVAATNAAAAAAQPTATATLVVAATNTPAPEEPSAVPTEAPPTPTTVDTSTMSEEELAAAIDEAVAAAIAASEELAAATTTAATDGTITYEETVAVEVTLTNAEEALALAEALVAAYHGAYGEYASEALYTLEEVESDLEAMAEDIETIAEILAQGSEAASAAVEELAAAAAAASANGAQVQAQTQGWHEALRAEIENRAATALATQPTQIAPDRQGAVQSALQYVETVRSGLADGAVSPGELSEIAQAGANASASIRTHGGPGLENVADSIDGLTKQVARGELPQAKGSLDALESSLPRRP